MTATALNHVSITAQDLDASAAFYEELLGLQTVPNMRFSVDVRWLRVGDLELHLVRTDGPAPVVHHFALVVDDFNAAFEAATARGVRELQHPVFNKVYALPDGAVHMYVRDPAGNLVELIHPDAGTVDHERVSDVRVLADDHAQPQGTAATLFLTVPAPASS